MHELTIAAEIFDYVLEFVNNAKISKVISISLEIGALVAVDEESLKFSFETISQRSSLHGAELVININKIRSKCRVCGKVFIVKNWTNRCPSCKGIDNEIIAGNNIYIKNLEIDYNGYFNT
ncbi:hydrogenase maturation nickel metallochaperone HypA [candidate division KSB1 bacterium]